MDAEAATAEVLDSFESIPAPPPRSLKVVRKEDEGNGEHIMSSSPPRATEAAIREATHGMLLATTSFMKTMEAQAVQNSTATQTLSRAMEVMVQQQAKPSNGKWTGWIQTGVICGMLLVSGTNVFKTSEATLDGRITQANNAAQDAKRDAADAAREAKKANINNAMLDTYNRELERALIRKGVALPSYPVLEK